MLILPIIPWTKKAPAVPVLFILADYPRKPLVFWASTTRDRASM